MHVKIHKAFETFLFGTEEGKAYREKDRLFNEAFASHEAFEHSLRDDGKIFLSLGVGLSLCYSEAWEFLRPLDYK